MSQSLLSRSPELAPFLIRLHDTRSMYEGADNKHVAEQKLSEVMADFLCYDKIPQFERELVTDVLMTLVKQAQKDLKLALAHQLSARSDVPLRFVLSLIEEDLGAAQILLEESPVLEDCDLLYIIQAHGAEYWRSIAKRKMMGNVVVEELARTGDVETALNLCANDNISLNEKVFDTLSIMAANHENIGKSLIERTDISMDLTLKIYQHVSDALKEKIRQKFPTEIAMRSIDDLEDIRADIEESYNAEQYHPTLAQMEKAGNLKRTNRLTLSVIMDTVKTGQLQFFVACLSSFLDLKPSTIIEALKMPMGKGVVMLARAADLYRSDFISVFMLTRIIREGKKPVDHSELSRVMGLFDKVGTETCRHYLSRLDSGIK